MNRWVVCAFGLVTSLLSATALAEVKHEGAWPLELKHVSIDGHLGRTDAVMRIAKEAGWSVVLRGVDDGKPMDVHLYDQPADKALDVVLGDGDFVAKRDGTLITITSVAAPPPAAPSAALSVAPPPPPPTPSPSPSVRGEDRVVHGDDLTIAADETVHDVNVFGGSVVIHGTATGNVTVLGGSLHVKKGAHVVGSATAMGGSIDVSDGAEVDGDVNVVGGSLDRHKGAKIGGTVRKNDDVRVGASSSSANRSFLREVSDATTRAAMLFVFGAVLFALMGNRMNALRIEVASRPMRSFALGLVGGILGIAAILLVGVTIIGIPVAVVMLLGAIFAAYAGICAVLATVGKALIGHKTDNPHIHLLVGCALFLVSGALPIVNGLVTVAVVLIGIGVVVATRAAGAFAPNGRAAPLSTGPYRT
jgi:hypothetical protein